MFVIGRRIDWIMAGTAQRKDNDQYKTPWHPPLSPEESVPIVAYFSLICPLLLLVLSRPSSSNSGTPGSLNSPSSLNSRPT